MKDYIHVHSFTYDFHIRTILSIIQKRTRIDGTLNLHHLLDRFCRHYQNPPHYIRNRICKGERERERRIKREREKNKERERERKNNKEREREMVKW